MKKKSVKTNSFKMAVLNYRCVKRQLELTYEGKVLNDNLVDDGNPLNSVKFNNSVA